MTLNKNYKNKKSIMNKTSLMKKLNTNKLKDLSIINLKH